MRKKVKYSLIMLMLTLFIIPQVSQVLAIDSVAVSGTVTDTYGTGIDGALVELKIHGNGRVVDTDYTSNGQYDVSSISLPGLEHSVWISKSTFVSESAAGFYPGAPYTNVNFMLHHVASVTGTDWARTLDEDVEDMVDAIVYEQNPFDYELAEYIYRGIVTLWNHGVDDGVPPVIQNQFEKDTTIIASPFYSGGEYLGLCYQAAVISSAYSRAYSSTGLPNGLPTRLIHFEAEYDIDDHYSTEVLIEWESSAQWVPLDVDIAYDWFGRSQGAKDNITTAIGGSTIEHISIIWTINGETDVISDRMDVVDPGQYAWYETFLEDLV